LRYTPGKAFAGKMYFCAPQASATQWRLPQGVTQAQ